VPQTEAPAAEYLPTGQVSQIVPVRKLWYLPAAHALQDNKVGPKLRLKPSLSSRPSSALGGYPELQVHLSLPASECALVTHCAHLSEAVKEYLPASQIVQTEAPANEYVPATQMLQSAALVDEYLPASQFKHIAAPALEYLPTLQLSQYGHEGQKMFPNSLYFPAAQIVHS